MRYSIALAFLSVVLLSACGRPAEVQPIETTTDEVVQTGEIIKSQDPVNNNYTSTPTNDIPTTSIVQAPADTTSIFASYTFADVASNNTSRSCWSVINNKVYDLTSFIEKHPGGAEAILKMCGKDGTAILHRAHGMGKDDNMEKYYIGDLTQ